MYYPQQPMQQQSPFLQFNPAVFNHDLPQSPGPYPQFQHPNQALNGWLPHAAAYLKLALRDGIQQNPHFATGIAILSQNNWATQDMVMVMSTIVDHAARLHQQGNQPPDTALQQAAWAAADGFSAIKQLEVIQRQQMQMDPQYVGFLQQRASQWNSVIQGLMQAPGGVIAQGHGMPMHQPQHQQHQQHQYVPANRINTHGVGGMAPGAAQTGRGMVSGRFSSPSPQHAAPQQQQQYSHNFNTGPTTSRDLLSNPNNLQGSPNVHIPAPNPERASGNAPGTQWSQNQNTAPQALTQPAPLVQMDFDLAPGVDYSLYTPVTQGKPLPAARNLERPHDDFLAKDGSWLAPKAFHFDLERTWASSHPHRHVYDPEQRLVFVRRASGKHAGRIVEEIHSWNANMDYLKHEVNPRLREREIQKRQRVSNQVEVTQAAAWNIVTTLKPDEQYSISLPQDPGADLEALQTYQVTQAGQHFYAESVGEALQLARDLSVIVAPSDSEENTSTIEFYYDQPQLVDCDTSQLRLVLQLTKAAKDFDKLHEKLKEILERDTDEASQKLFGIINQRLTAAVNEAVARTFSIEGWTIDSFVADFPALMDAFKEEYGERLVTGFREMASLIARPAVAVATLDELTGYLSRTLGLEGEELESKISKTILLVYRVSVTTVGWERGAIKAFIDGGGLIDKESLPDLHEAVQTIFDRTPDNPLFYANRFLLTKDLNLLEIRRAALVKDSFLIFDDGYIDMPMAGLSTDDLVLDL